MAYYYNKEMFGAFDLLTACMRLRALRLTGRREGSSDKCPLAKGTGGEVKCRINGLTRQSSQERSIVSCCLPCHPIDSKYNSSRMDIDDKFLTHVM